ncbi:WecB/TagA/CpsF family glycosyltransferase [Anaeromicropila herbilytica]|uniref:N-acetylglucosaminyldiphosphoundecaprenol N-acetyl-beta-D-mannosaminyltransferase n=1 Tax=Anaeromicropila herbilytica TaxID=2785025 RepID=A0A7R7EPQ2_9FIRM|nr:WecB/TagA/CpsF family glycosyltransferase [Anaeromicropila herbilytica]BCN32654.1 hypothetical protein bsdtb5_39490 [Anaeromicropila herbilytica]
METKVNIMDLEVDIISIDYLILNCKGFLTNDSLNIIYLVSTKTIQETMNDEHYIECFQNADFVLPGEETVLSLHHVDTLQTQGMIVDYHFLYSMFESITEDEKTVFIVGRNENEIERYKQFNDKNYEHLKIVGSFTEKDLEKEEIVINEINSIAPDILIFAIDSPLQEKWIASNYLKLNAKLCISIGGVIEHILKDNKEIPTWIKKIKLETLYRRLFQSKKVHKIKEAYNFKKRMQYYKSKKENKIENTK